MATPKPRDNKKQTTKNTPKRYIGIATCKIAGINVSDEKFKELTGHDRKKPLNILDRNESNPAYVRANVELILQTIPEHCNGISATFIKRLNVNNTLVTSKKGKYCMIDQYGRTAWLSYEEANNKNVPFIVANSEKGQFIRRIEPASMRQCYGGEELLMNFIRAIYGAFDVSKMEEEGDKKVYKGNLIDNPEPSRLDNIQAMFSGDYIELNNAIEAVKDNWVKIAIGVGQTDNGTVHVIYDYFMRPFEGPSNVKYKITNDSKDEFRLASWDFEPLHEFKGMSSMPAHATIPAPTPVQPIVNQEPDLPF